MSYWTYHYKVAVPLPPDEDDRGSIECVSVGKADCG